MALNNPANRPPEKSMVLHPYNIFLTLILASITVLFLAFSAAYVYSRVEEDMPAIDLPIIFYFNTLILLGSSFTMKWAKKCYLKDNTEHYQLALLSTIILTIIFMICQYVGWTELIDRKLFMGTENSSSYLYLISGLHFAHVLTGLPFLVIFLNTARVKMKEPVSVLVYFSDPEKTTEATPTYYLLAFFGYPVDIFGYLFFNKQPD